MMCSDAPRSIPTVKNPPESVACRLAVGAIGLYQKTLGLLLGGQCRFFPSCSWYAKEAFLCKPFWTAFFLTTKRLLKCHPFHPGGYDPVPTHQESAHFSNKDKTHG